MDGTISSCDDTPAFWWLSGNMYDIHGFAYKATVTSKEDALVLFVPAQAHKLLALWKSSFSESCKKGE